MRSHRHILREIAVRNLDTKVAYVVGENNKLVEKEKRTDADSKEDQILSLEEKTESDQSQTSQVLEDVKEEKPKKRLPPPRKKKEVIATE